MEVEFKDRLKECMEEFDITQSDIMRMCAPYEYKYEIKITRSNLSFWLSGRSNPSAEKLIVLAAAFGVQPLWLLGYDYPKNVKLAELVPKFNDLNEINKSRIMELIDLYSSSQ